jgi:hypothetical protein
MEALHARKTVSKSKPVTVAGFENQSTRIIGGKVNVDAKVVEASLNADYDQIVTLSTGAAQVYESDDDNISTTVLRNVGRDCRNKIAEHLKLRRWVFVAAKAIQAYDYDATFERVASASAAAKCTFLTWCRWVKGEGELKGKITDKTHGAASKTFVTIALVPAEVEVGRQSIEMADLQTLLPERKVRRFARRSRMTELSPMRDGRFAVATARR